MRNLFKRFFLKSGSLSLIADNKVSMSLENAKINLCSGSKKVSGYVGIDINPLADIVVDLSKADIPLQANSAEFLVCISAINYFTRKRSVELIKEVYRVVKPGGIVRFGVQDMEAIAKRYVDKDNEFFFQKLPDGRERFEGPTLGDKFAAWFYGYVAGGYPCQYFYDYNSLAHLFKEAGFSIVERKAFLESRLTDIDKIDNRPDQMFFLEAVK